MEAKKIVHLQFKEPYNGETDFYFGSLKAIYDTVPIGTVGITYKSLTNATRGRSEYENKKVLIRIGQIQRKTRCRQFSNICGRADRLVDSCAKAWQNAGKAVNLHKYWIMEAKKIVHLQFKEPYNGETDFYFGSLKAIYDTVPIGTVGITYKSLTNATRGRSEYENKKVLIRIGQIQRKTRGWSLKSECDG